MEPRGPWTRLDTEVVYANPWITVRHDRVITPSGGEGIYGVVEVERAIGIVPLHEDRTVTLVGQYRYPLDVYSWEIPEGAAGSGETEEEAARRELAEETGLRTARLDPLGTVHTSNCFTNEVAHLFLARDLHQGEASPDETEDLVVRRMPFETAIGMVRSGDIQDAMTIVALYRAAELLA